MYTLIKAQRFQVSMVVGIDDKGMIFQFTNRLNPYPVTAFFRPNAHSASLIRASIIKALEGSETDFLPIEFPADCGTVRAQFQTISNKALGTFKRALFLFPKALNRNAQGATSFLVVVRDGELKKLQTILEQTYKLQD